jgi:hypothetical protein
VFKRKAALAGFPAGAPPASRSALMATSLCMARDDAQCVMHSHTTAGMAEFGGEGPAGTYCRDCNHFAVEIDFQTGINIVKKTRSGCVIWG